MGHFRIEPTELLAESGPECLGHGFLGGKAGGVVGSRVGLVRAVGLLGRSEDLVEKTGPVPVKRIADAGHFNLVDAHPDHLASPGDVRRIDHSLSIRLMVWTASAKPWVSERAMMLCPMLYS